MSACPSGTKARAVQQLAQLVVGGDLVDGAQVCLLGVANSDWPDGRLFWAARDRSGPAPEITATSFRIASVSKMVTATTLLGVVDAGRLSLDDAVHEHLDPEIAARLDVFSERWQGSPPTLRMLLDHTSGLPDFFDHPEIWAAIRRADRRRAFTPSDLLALALEREPTFLPGEGRQYNDTGFVLAGMAIEHVTGLALHEAMRQFVLAPAGMEHTWLESAADAPRTRDVLPHDIDGVDITGMDPTVDWGGGGLVSTIPDLIAFLRALTTGQLLSRQTSTEMTRWAPGPTGFYDDYGLGVGRFCFEGGDAVGHHGIWGAFAFHLPGCEAYVAGTVSTARKDRRPLLRAIVDALV